MAWLVSAALMQAYENSHSSQEPVVESLADTSSDGEPSVLSSETHTPQAYCAPDKMKAFSRLSRSGMMFATLTADRGEAVLTWCLEASRARTSAQPDEEQELTGLGRDSGEKWRELWVRYDRDSSSWRTHRALFDEVLPESSVTLPRWGMMRGGVCWEQLTPSGVRAIRASIMSAKESGFLVKTSKLVREGRRAADGEMVMRVPTPRSSDHRGAVNPSDTTLGRAMNGLANLCEAIQTLRVPTPTASEDAAGRPGVKMQKMLGNHPDIRGDLTGGSLNPTWVEWLMGWPLGWTDLGPLGMDRFQQWQHSHGNCSAGQSPEVASDE